MHLKYRSSEKEYFSHYLECAFKDFAFTTKDGSKKKRQHVSFISGHTGMVYANEHHMIQNKTLERSGCPKYLRDDIRNCVRLCPVCHDQIHQGTKKEVLEMFNYLYDKNADWYESNYIRYANNNNFETVKEWMIYCYTKDKMDL